MVSITLAFIFLLSIWVFQADNQKSKLTVWGLLGFSGEEAFHLFVSLLFLLGLFGMFGFYCRGIEKAAQLMSQTKILLINSGEISQ